MHFSTLLLGRCAHWYMGHCTQRTQPATQQYAPYALYVYNVYFTKRNLSNIFGELFFTFFNKSYQQFP